MLRCEDGRKTPFVACRDQSIRPYTRGKTTVRDGDFANTVKWSKKNVSVSNRFRLCVHVCVQHTRRTTIRSHPLQTISGVAVRYVGKRMLVVQCRLHDKVVLGSWKIMKIIIVTASTGTIVELGIKLRVCVCVRV